MTPIRAARRRHRTARGPATTTVHCVAARRRSADVLGVYETLAEAESAAALLAACGIPDAGIAVVVLPGSDRPRTTRPRVGVRPTVLLRGHPHHVERAHEILADAAAQSHHGFQSAA